MVYRLWTPRHWLTMRARRWTVGVDFGGTNIKVGLVDPRGRIARSRVVPSRRFGRPDAFIEAISNAVGSITGTVGIRPAQLRGVGVGAPGTVDVQHGVVHACVNVAGWHDVPLRRHLERRLRCRCAVDNDANLLTLGEWRFGSGRGATQLVGVTLGTGIGGGLLFDGRLVRGASGSAGEIGHMVIDRRGPRCGCGRRGCLEALVGTAAIVRMARRAIRRGAEPLGTLAREAQGCVVPRMVGRAARAGDRLAREVWEKFGRRLGIGLANVVNVVNPDRIVIGGGVANNWALFAPALRRTLRAEAFEVPARAVRVVRASLGDRAGIIGAAVLVWNEIG